VAPGADEPITALLDLAIDDVGEFWVAREAAKGPSGNNRIDF
jgi:hypothetical protein